VPSGKEYRGESARIPGQRRKAPQGTRSLRSKVYCVILHKKYAPPLRGRSSCEVCLRRHPERATQKKKENNMSERITLSLDENPYIKTYIN